MARMMTTVLTNDLAATRDTLSGLLDLKVEFDSDWFVSMSNEHESIYLGAMKPDCQFVPEGFQTSVQGVMVTVVVDNVEHYFAKARKLQVRILEEPRNLPYGQRRMLVLDPSGLLIDISSPTAPLDPRFA